jgi:drug/metabolite transporter (DMT)-like permease
MSAQRTFQNLLQINLAVVFMGTSGFFGRYIDLPVPVIICSRSLLAGLFLFLFLKLQRVRITIHKKDVWHIFGGGLLLGIHWLTYFHSLKLSNVAIAMLSLYTFPVITIVLEPLVLKTRFQLMHLALSVMVLVGIYFLVPEFNLQHEYTRAVGWGVFSAFCYALRNILLKPKVGSYHGTALMFLQLAVIGVVLSPALFLYTYPGFLPQWEGTLGLAFITTALGHTLFLYTLRNFSTASVSLMTTTTPVYGALIAFFFLGEVPTLSTVIGGLIIISTVVVESLRSTEKLRLE